MWSVETTEWFDDWYASLSDDERANVLAAMMGSPPFSRTHLKEA